MKALLIIAAGLGITYLVYPQAFTWAQQQLGMATPGAPTAATNTGATAPISNPPAPTTIGGGINISGSNFGTAATGTQNSVA